MIIAEEKQEQELEEAESPVLANDSADLPVNVRALHIYFRTGSMAEVSRQLGLTLYELGKIQATSWWADELQALRRDEAARMNVKFSSILSTSMDKLEERLEKGNIALRNGRLVHVPLTATELTRILDVVFDKRQLLRGEATVIAGDNKKLQALHEKLEKLGMSGKTETDLTNKSIDQPVQLRVVGNGS